MSTNSNDFSGIWNREDPENKILNIANEMGENRGPVGNFNKKTKKQWSFIDVFFSLIVLLFVQVLVSIPLIATLQESIQSGETDALTLATPPLLILVSSLAMYAVWIGSMWFSTRYRGENSFKKDFKLGFKKWDVFIGLGIAVGLYLTLFAVQLLLGLFNVDLSGADNGSTILGQEGIWFFVIAIGIASLLGPISEEFFFRGYLMNSVIKSAEKRQARVEKLKLTKQNAPVTVLFTNFFMKYKNVIAVIVSSAIFGMFHFQGTFDFGGIFIVLVTGTLGAVFAITTLKTGRLGPAIFGHVFYNFGTLMVSLIFAV